MDTTFDAVRAEALFASDLQRSQRPASDEVREAVTATLRRLGTRGCLARLATEFGEHPETAAARMSWAVQMIRESYQGASEMALAG